MISSETSALTDILTQEEIDSLLNTASENKKILPQDLLKNASKQQKYPAQQGIRL